MTLIPGINFPTNREEPPTTTTWLIAAWIFCTSAYVLVASLPLVGRAAPGETNSIFRGYG